MDTAMAGQSGKADSACYCGLVNHEDETLTCTVCSRMFHTGCLVTGRPSVLKGDVFFKLICKQCGINGEESCERIKLQWLHVVLLTLYNLQLNAGGKYGYFRWKEQVCAFISKNWDTLFGTSKKRTSLWYGTVAGVLSSGCPALFTSGVAELHEPGWWKLTTFEPPSLHITTPSRYKKMKIDPALESLCVTEGLRSRSCKTSIQSAIELKARRSTLMEAKELRRSRGKMSAPSKSSPSWVVNYLTEPRLSRHTSPATSVEEVMSVTGDESLDTYRDQLMSSSEFAYTSVSDTTPGSLASATGCVSDSSLQSSVSQSHPQLVSNNDPSWLTQEGEHELSGAGRDDDDEDEMVEGTTQGTAHDDYFTQLLNANCDLDLHIDPVVMSPPSDSPLVPTSPSLQEMLDSMTSSPSSSIETNLQPHDDRTMTRVERGENHSVMSGDSECCSESEEEPGGEDEQGLSGRGRQGGVEREEVKPQVRYTHISEYDEEKLLEALNNVFGDLCDPMLRRLRRKLLVRKEKRQNNMPVFNLDETVNRALGNKEKTQCHAESHTQSNVYNIPVSHGRVRDPRVLDRYQVKEVATEVRVTFRMRLVGRADHELQPVRSPYTTRLLKPFIRRDSETRPRKLQLLEEIIAYPHRHDPHWQPPPMASIDYCYVRPEHIATVNSLCHQFFWPGIDLSECLHYPDFSCVVLYRKIVIGFAFMVPDLAESRHNEAYISFIFTHPEWQRAGIGTFMVYHLIQTCMGKDLTLHVAANNPAMMLYQKFGFKPEEYIQGFYDKYYPLTTDQCMNAFFLRLQR